MIGSSIPLGTHIITSTSIHIYFFPVIAHARIPYRPVRLSRHHSGTNSERMFLNNLLGIWVFVYLFMPLLLSLNLSSRFCYCDCDSIFHKAMPWMTRCGFEMPSKLNGHLADLHSCFVLTVNASALKCRSLFWKLITESQNGNPHYKEQVEQHSLVIDL